MPLLRKQLDPKVVLGIMLTGTFFASVSQSMLTSALPTIMHEFGINATLGQLLTTSYIYVLGIVAAFSAYLITRCNVRRLFLGALALFCAGCAVAYLSTGYGALLASRLMQACGTGVLMPLMQVIALELYPKERHGHALGLVGLVFGFAPVVGPTLSGIITDMLGWRTIFAILGCGALLSLAGSSFVVRDVGKHERTVLDVPSMLLYTFGLVVFMVGVTGLEQFGFFDARAFGPTLVGVVLVAVFAVRQLRVDRPYLKLALFRNRTFATGVVLLVIAQAVMMSSALQVPLCIQEIHGYTPTESGLILLAGALCMPLLNPLTGRLYDRFGGKLNGMIGFFLLVVGTGSFVFFSSDISPLWIAGMYMVRMVGIAFVLMPMTAYCMTDLEGADVPQGAAIVNSFRQICGSLGSSVMMAVVTSVSVDAGSIDVSMVGFSVSFAIQALFAAVAFICVLLFVRGKRQTRKPMPSA